MIFLTNTWRFRFWFKFINFQANIHGGMENQNLELNNILTWVSRQFKSMNDYCSANITRAELTSIWFYDRTLFKWNLNSMFKKWHTVLKVSFPNAAVFCPPTYTYREGRSHFQARNLVCY